MAGFDSTEAMQRFVDGYSLDFPQLVSEDGTLWAHFGVPYQPAWVFVNDDGRVTVIQGALDAGELRRRLEELAPDRAPQNGQPWIAVVSAAVAVSHRGAHTGFPPGSHRPRSLT